jgi:hypothetical protein
MCDASSLHRHNAAAHLQLAHRILLASLQTARGQQSSETVG